MVPAFIQDVLTAFAVCVILGLWVFLLCIPIYGVYFVISSMLHEYLANIVKSQFSNEYVQNDLLEILTCVTNSTDQSKISLLTQQMDDILLKISLSTKRIDALFIYLGLELFLIFIFMLFALYPRTRSRQYEASFPRL